MIPLRDENPTRTVPLLTLVLIAACVGIYFLVQQPARSQDAFAFENAAIPCEVVKARPLTVDEVEDTVGRGDATACDDRPEGPSLFPDKSVWFAVLYSMFLHGGLLHLGGNMLYLWVFGNNVEDTLGKVPFIVFYLLSGLAATLAHVAIQPSSTVPLVGASGAIAGVMGAYLVLFPRAPIHTLIVFIFIMFREIEARWLLIIWFVMQFFVNPNEGVAWMAHVGGFVFGVVGGLMFRSRRRPGQHYAY